MSLIDSAIDVPKAGINSLVLEPRAPEFERV